MKYSEEDVSLCYSTMLGHDIMMKNKQRTYRKQRGCRLRRKQQINSCNRT